MINSNATNNRLLGFIINYWPCLLFLLAIIGFISKSLYNYPVAIMALIGLYKVLRTPDAFINDPVIRYFTLAFTCLWLPLLISLIDAVNLSHSLNTVLPYLRFLFAGIFVIDEIGKDEKRLRFIISSIFFIVLFWCLDAIIQFIFGKNLAGFPYDRSYISGMFHPRNTIGHICSILSSISFLYLYIKANNNKYLLLSLIPLFFVVLLSGSRSSWVMLALSSIGFIIFIYKNTNNKKQILAVTSTVIVVISILLASTVVLHDRTNSRFKETMSLFSTDYESINKATAVRLPIWETATNIFKSNFINGIGPRGFRHVYRDYSPPDNFWHEWAQTHPHLLFLEILTETGIIGFAGYILLIYMLVNVLRKPGNSIYKYPLFIAVIVSLFPLNAHMAFYGSIWSSMIWLLLSLFFANSKLST